MKILSHKINELSTLKSNTMVDVECDCCHIPFKKECRHVKSCIKRGRNHFFCNPQCFKDFTISKYVKQYTCKSCNKQIIRKQSSIKTPTSVFCSRSCAAIYNNKQRYKNHVYKIKPEKAPKIIQIRQNPKTKKIKTVKVKKIEIKCMCNCGQCGLLLLKTKNDLSPKNNKNGIPFCSRSCRMKYQNLNNHKSYSCRRSRAETFLCNLIKMDYPSLTILENNRTILSSKLEIDIYVVDFKLAIELNGPVHYFPIYGDERLKRCQDNDTSKKCEMQSLGISLITMDISRLCSKKKTNQFLTEYYQSHIKPILSRCG